MDGAAHELRSILTAYAVVMRATWPDLNPTLTDRAARWSSLDEGKLRAELDQYLREAAPPRSNVRIFWKLGPKFIFGGCNDSFAKDAGMKSPSDVIGIDDFDKRLPWRHQAAKYRRDDEAVVSSGKAQLDIVERQQSTDGSITWVRAAKAPIISTAGEVIGLLGMYEFVDSVTGRALFMKAMKEEK